MTEFQADRIARPLADRMRPMSLDDVVGQQQLVSPNKPLRVALEGGRVHSMVFWGPPGTGKTTLSRLVAEYCEAEFISLSAVLSGVKDIRAAVDGAKQRRAAGMGSTVLFVDEVHRFNKAQQDAFLPHVEDGTIIFVGATTENPSFELNNALLSRVRVYVLKALEANDIRLLIERTIQDQELGLGSLGVQVADEAIEWLSGAVDGDARRALTMLEIASDLCEENLINLELIQSILAGGQMRRFDNKGEAYYDQISALHKSVRGSDPDAGLYWLCRMLDGGAEPRMIARRLVRMASEDIGNADPRALRIALDAWEAQERVGSPEGELSLAQAVVYLCVAAKSNAVYTAYKQAMALAKESGSLEVPLHLRNASTQLMKDLNYGKGYRYAHNEDSAYAIGESYLPEPLLGTQFYHPVDRGLEIKIAEKLAYLRSLNRDRQ